MLAELSLVDPAWISLVDAEQLNGQLDILARCRERSGYRDGMPLYGVPFAVKDNSDVAGLPTTAACPAYH